jgi:hypothetical protein
MAGMTSATRRLRVPSSARSHASALASAHGLSITWRDGTLGPGSAAIDRAVGARLERQEILAREDPPMLWHVLHEGVLRHVVGGPAIMAAQLDKLAELAAQPGIVIQILPFSASDHPGTDGPILVYDFAGASSVAYTECNGGGRVVESADEVGDLTMILNMIRAAALPPRESVSLIRKIRGEIADV